MSDDLVSITLGGEGYQLRASLGSYRDIEARTEMTIKELFEVALAERLSMDEAIAIVWCGAQAAGEEFSDLEAVGAALFELRLTNLGLRTSICKFLLALSYTPETAAKKFEAEVEPTLQAQTEIT